ncbi:hypothetical protein HBH61_177890 [Parastagonospora nodorum]|nr:hypothetical protein HBH61_177890 [Parastagonospora nodorum]
MSKRPASPSSVIESPASKKQKINETIAQPIATAPTPGEVTATRPQPADTTDIAKAPEVAGPVAPPVTTYKVKKANKKETKAKIDPKPKKETTLKEPKVKKEKVVKVRGTPAVPTVQDAFIPWTPDDAQLPKPKNNGWWGIKPVSGDPRPHPDQPSARSSNGATNPPMYEDRGFRFKRGSRYVKYFGPIKPDGADDGPDLDQEDLLILKLVDMRSEIKGKKGVPKDVPVVPKRTAEPYFCEHGKPKDWNDKQALKALNDRRTQAIDRVSRDAPWTKSEREYLSELLTEHPDASIWELAELHNDHFMEKEVVMTIGFELSEGRTVESVRHEYVTYKPLYDQGGVPVTRWSRNKSEQGERIDKKMIAKFGKPGRVMKVAGDEDDSGSDDAADEGAEEVRISTPKKKRTKKSPVKKTKDAELTVKAAIEMTKQPKLNDSDEELLQLAGLDDPEQIRTSPPGSLPPNSPLRTRAFSWSSGSSLSDVPSDLHTPGNSPILKSKTPSKDQGTLVDVLTWISDSHLSDQPADLESPGTQDFKAALTTLNVESVETVVTEEQLKAVEPVVPIETLVEQVITIQEQIQEQVQEDADEQMEYSNDEQTVVKDSIPETKDSPQEPIEEAVSSILSPELKPAPTPRAIRDIVIDEDYDDDDEL